MEFLRQGGKWVMRMTKGVTITGEALTMEAREGWYDPDRGLLELFGMVVLYRGQARLRAESLRLWVDRDSLLAWGQVYLEDSLRRIWGDTLLSTRDSSLLWGRVRGELLDRNLRFSGHRGLFREGGAAELWGAPRFWVFRAETVEARANRFHSRGDTLWGLGAVHIRLRDGEATGDTLVFSEDSTGERVWILGDARFVGNRAEGHGDTLEVVMRQGKPRQLILRGETAFALESDSLRVRLRGPHLVIELDEAGEVRQMRAQEGEGIYIRKEEKEPHGGPES